MSAPIFLPARGYEVSVYSGSPGFRVRLSAVPVFSDRARLFALKPFARFRTRIVSGGGRPQPGPAFTLRPFHIPGPGSGMRREFR